MNALTNFGKLRILILFLACMSAGARLSCLQAARAMEILSTDPSSVVEPYAPQTSTQQSSASPSIETSPKQKSETKKEEGKKKSDHAGSFVVAPLPIVSPALGSGVIPILGYIIPIPTKDRKVEPSVMGAGGLITNDGSRGFVLGGDFYLKHARYELESLYAHGNLDYNLYGVGFVNGNAGFKLPLEQTGQMYFLKFLRNIGWDIYVGGRFITGNSFITLKPTSNKIPPIPPDVGLHTDLRALGGEVRRDSRPNRFYPLKGSVIDFTGDFFGQDLGSKYSFQSYKFTFNKYLSLTDRQVLAYNVYWCSTGGSPPFYGNCIYGASS
jgi:hypothetical protein